MKRLLYAGLVLAVCTRPGRAADVADETEKLIQSMLKSVEDLGALMKKVTDKESADENLSKIKDLSKKFAEVKSKADKVKVEKDVEVKLLKKYEKKLFDAGFVVGSELTRLQQIDPAKDVVAEVKKFLETLQGAAPKEEPMPKKE